MNSRGGPKGSEVALPLSFPLSLSLLAFSPVSAPSPTEDAIQDVSCQVMRNDDEEEEACIVTCTRMNGGHPYSFIHGASLVPQDADQEPDSHF